MLELLYALLHTCLFAYTGKYLGVMIILAYTCKMLPSYMIRTFLYLHYLSWWNKNVLQLFL